MFGTFRFILSLIVTFGHLHGPFWIGTYAVFGFYLLSGYLMTLIMNQSYGYTKNGFKKYFLNRLLRIYPVYYISSLISIFSILLVGRDTATQFNLTLAIPSNIYTIILNTTIFGLHSSVPERLIPPAWALSVELVFYILIGLFLGRSQQLSKIWLMSSMIITALLIFSMDDWSDRYFPIYAASLPFSLGCFLFWHQELFNRFQFIKGKLFLSILLLLNLANFYFSNLTSRSFKEYFYVNLILVFMTIVSLSHQKRLFFIDKSLDRILGELSYPIYLCHFQFGLLAFVYSGANNIKGIDIFFLSLAPLIIFSRSINILLETRINKIRQKIKAGV